MENYLSIGKIVSAFGVKGEMVLEHHLGEEATLQGVQAIFIEELGGKFLPYFIVSVKKRTDTELLILIEGVDTPEKARKLVRKKIWLKEEDAKKNASASAPISLLGFSVMEKKKVLGQVLEVIEQPLQILLRIEIDGKEVLIPVNESTLQGIDHKRRQVLVKLPEGLLDIYLT